MFAPIEQEMGWYSAASGQEFDFMAAYAQVEAA